MNGTDKNRHLSTKITYKNINRIDTKIPVEKNFKSKG